MGDDLKKALKRDQSIHNVTAPRVQRHGTETVGPGKLVSTDTSPEAMEAALKNLEKLTGFKPPQRKKKEGTEGGSTERGG